jgi:hypothetical protein
MPVDKIPITIPAKKVMTERVNAALLLVILGRSPNQ